MRKGVVIRVVPNTLSKKVKALSPGDEMGTHNVKKCAALRCNAAPVINTDYDR